MTGIDTDFADRNEGPSTQTSLPRAGVWGQSEWDDAVWSDASNIVKNWGGTASWPGRWLSGNVRIVSDSISAQWVGSLIRFNVGNGL